MTGDEIALKADVKYCTACGHEIPAAAEFCTSCGAKCKTAKPLTPITSAGKSPLFIIAAIFFTLSTLVALYGNYIGITLTDAFSSMITNFGATIRLGELGQIADILDYILESDTFSSVWSAVIASYNTVQWILTMIKAIIGISAIISLVTLAGVWITFAATKKDGSQSVGKVGMTMLIVTQIILAVVNCGQYIGYLVAAIFSAELIGAEATGILTAIALVFLAFTTVYYVVILVALGRLSRAFKKKTYSKMPGYLTFVLFFTGVSNGLAALIFAIIPFLGLPCAISCVTAILFACLIMAYNRRVKDPAAYEITA